MQAQASYHRPSWLLEAPIETHVLRHKACPLGDWDQLDMTMGGATTPFSLVHGLSLFTFFNDFSIDTRTPLAWTGETPEGDHSDNY